MADAESETAVNGVGEENGSNTPYYDDLEQAANGEQAEAADGATAESVVQEEALSPPPTSRKRARTEEDEANGHAATRYEAVTEQAKTKLEPSIFGVAPLDEFAREVADWLASWLVDREHVEVEAKIGRLVYNGTQNRLDWPIVATETIIRQPDQLGVHFDSDMPIETHKHYNKILNNRVDEQRDPSFSAPPIAYKHPLERDVFHTVQGRKIRATFDQKTGQHKESVYKERIANMEIYQPKHLFDVRISVSVEVPVPQPGGQGTHERLKDRLSYTQQPYRIDLTQVKSPNNRDPMRHELEVEIADMPNFQREAVTWREDPDNSVFLELVQAFLGNVRMLVRNPP